MEPRPDQDPLATGTRAPDDIGPRHLGLAIRRDGVWLYQGSPIQRLPLVKLFASVLRREDDGRYWMVTPVERGIVDVEDVPFVGVELAAEGMGPGQTVRIRTNLDHWVEVGPGHPLTMRRPPWAETDSDERAPYIRVRDRLDARLGRGVYYELVELGAEHEVDGETRFGIWSQGHFFGIDHATTG